MPRHPLVAYSAGPAVVPAEGVLPAASGVIQHAFRLQIVQSMSSYGDGAGGELAA